MNDSILKLLSEYCDKKYISQKYYIILKEFYKTYKKEVATYISEDKLFYIFKTFLNLAKEQIASPYKFEPYHKKIRKPFDYYKFGIDFLKPLIIKEKSRLLGKENFEQVKGFLKHGENVILFANHQTESDPQAISILLENNFPELASKIIYVAGERVISDPLAIPFSIGCDLLCVYSKKYIDNPPELKKEKQLHNQKTMLLMSNLLKEGGKIIYVAPSGGRDRPDKHGKTVPALFDAKNIEMFYLMSQKAATKTHFFPLTLLTYDLLPPPENIQIEMGERRITKRGTIHIYLDKEIQMNKFVGTKQEIRDQRTKFIFEVVRTNYQKLLNL